MHNLVIDIGNTKSKVALFDNRELKDLRVSDILTVDAISAWFGEWKIDNAIVSSVKQDTTDLEVFLKSKCRYLCFDTGVKSGIINHYRTPETLGLDRYAAVIAAHSLFPGSDCLIIDAGTCITYDFIDGSSNYYGGSISPGVAMRLKAMNTFTGKLPLIEFDERFNEDYGHDTRSAMLSGVVNGVIYEVNGFIRHFFEKSPALKVLLCGGDVYFFDRQLKNSIFARDIITEPNLVLIGLNEVVQQYNE